MSTIYLGRLRISPQGISIPLDGPFPEAVVMAMAGRRLDELVDHPDVTGSWLGAFLITQATQKVWADDSFATLHLTLDAEAYALINKEFFSD